MFIFARPFWAVAAAMGVALLILWLDRACNPSQAALLDPLFPELPSQGPAMHAQASSCFGG